MNSHLPGSTAVPNSDAEKQQRLASLLRKDGQLLQIIDAALEDAARRAREHLACRPGCTQCCHGAFALDALDALRLRETMTSMRKSAPERAARLETRARGYIAEYGASFPGDAVRGILGDSEEDAAAFEDFANEAACPALDPATGLCEVYEARPMTCRVFGPPVLQNAEDDDAAAYSVCELCFTEASAETIAACAMTVPVAEEEALLGELQAAQQEGPGAMSGDTIVAYCLIGPDLLPQ